MGRISFDVFVKKVSNRSDLDPKENVQFLCLMFVLSWSAGVITSVRSCYWMKWVPLCCRNVPVWTCIKIHDLWINWYTVPERTCTECIWLIRLYVSLCIKNTTYSVTNSYNRINKSYCLVISLHCSSENMYCKKIVNMKYLPNHLVQCSRVGHDKVFDFLDNVTFLYTVPVKTCIKEFDIFIQWIGTLFQRGLVHSMQLS